MANKPIEYSSEGLPVMTSVTGALQVLLERYQCGVLFEEGNAESLATQLCELYDDPKRQGLLSQNAKRLFESKFEANLVYDPLPNV